MRKGSKITMEKQDVTPDESRLLDAARKTVLAFIDSPWDACGMLIAIIVVPEYEDIAHESLEGREDGTEGPFLQAFNYAVDAMDSSLSQEERDASWRSLLEVLEIDDPLPTIE